MDVDVIGSRNALASLATRSPPRPSSPLHDSCAHGHYRHHDPYASDRSTWDSSKYPSRQDRCIHTSRDNADRGDSLDDGLLIPKLSLTLRCTSVLRWQIVRPHIKIFSLERSPHLNFALNQSYHTRNHGRFRRCPERGPTGRRRHR